MAKLCDLVVFLIGVSTAIGQQSSLQCSNTDSNKDECILHHISDKLEQMSTLERRIDSAVQQIAEKVQEGAGESQNNCPTNPNLSCPETNDDATTDPTLPESCLDLYTVGHRISGIYRVYEPFGVSPFRSNNRRTITVFCEMGEDSNDSKGWMLIQRRQDGSVNFNRTWAQYLDGFGDIAGEHWLGNENLAIITGAPTPFELRVDLEDWDGEKRYARYNLFQIQSAALKYTLTIGNYSGNAGDSMSYLNGAQFNTPVTDNDLLSSVNCRLEYSLAGWWYKDCLYLLATLNNQYHNSSNAESWKGIVWGAWQRSPQYSLKKVQMKIRPLLEWEF